MYHSQALSCTWMKLKQKGTSTVTEKLTVPL